MPPASKTAHRVVENTALPYVTNESLTSTTSRWMQGSSNLMTSLHNWTENRPGFSTTFDATSFSSLKRNFIWRRWTNTTNGGKFIWMASDLSAGVAKVYKKILGI